MSYPTLASIYNLGRILLGDTEVSGGQLWSNSVLLPSLQSAYQDLIRAATQYSCQELRDEAFLYLPPYCALLDPLGQGVSLQRLEMVFSFPCETGKVPSNATVSSGGLQLAFPTAHGWSDGDSIALIGFSGAVPEINDCFTIQKISDTVIRLEGCAPSGTINAGTCYRLNLHSREPVTVRDTSLDLSAGSSSSLKEIAFLKGVFYPPVLTEGKILGLRYFVGDDLPASTVRLKGSLNYLAYQMASIALVGRNLQKSSLLAQQARVYLESLQVDWAQDLQQEQRRIESFNPLTGRPRVLGY